MRGGWEVQGVMGTEDVCRAQSVRRCYQLESSGSKGREMGLGISEGWVLVDLKKELNYGT